MLILQFIDFIVQPKIVLDRYEPTVLSTNIGSSNGKDNI